jgi:hypothetical protein
VRKSDQTRGRPELNAPSSDDLHRNEH